MPAYNTRPDNAAGHAEVIGGRLIIDVPIQDPQPSSTGKTLLVAQHNTPYDPRVLVHGRPARVALNVFIKPNAVAVVTSAPGARVDTNAPLPAVAR